VRTNVDYGTAEARTTWGVIGIKVWIYKGDLERGEKVDWRSQGEGNRPRGGGGRRQPSDRRPQG
jgi:small subunit ribosomal protein S3